MPLEAEPSAQTITRGIADIGPGAQQRAALGAAPDTSFEPRPGTLAIAIERG